MSPRPRSLDAQLSLLPVKRPEPRIPAHQAHSETSREAALRVIPRVNAYHEAILSALAQSNGLTRPELEDATGIQTQSICPRLVELEEMNAIRKLTYFDADSRSVKVSKRQNCSIYVLTRSAA